MGRVKKCIVCWNTVKAKLKIVSSRCPEEHLLIVFFLRKLMWTPLSDDSFKSYLKSGNPLEWVDLCHLCEKQVREAFDLHRKIMKLVNRLSEIRRQLYTDNLYDESDRIDANCEDILESNEIFRKIRARLLSDYRAEYGLQHSSEKSVILTYKTNTRTEDEVEQNNFEKDTCGQVKLERQSDNEDNFSDSFLQYTSDPFFDETVAGTQNQHGDGKYGTGNPTKNASKSDVESTKGSSPGGRSSNRKSRNSKLRQISNKNINQPPASKVIPEFTTKCPVCKKSFSTKGAFKRHYKECHLNSKEFQCPDCKQAFARKDYLISHVRLSHPNSNIKIVKSGAVEPSELKCLHCPRVYHIDASFRRHVRKMHPSANVKYGCDICGSKFERKDALSKHKKIYHVDEGEKDPTLDPDFDPRKCRICGKVLYSKKNMRRHITETHKMRYRDYEEESLDGVDDNELPSEDNT